MPIIEYQSSTFGADAWEQLELVLQGRVSIAQTMASYSTWKRPIFGKLPQWTLYAESGSTLSLSVRDHLVESTTCDHNNRGTVQQQ